MLTCPHCKKLSTIVTIQEVTGAVPFGNQYRCIAYLCFHCKAPLSIQMDPVALQADLVKVLRAS